MKETDYTKLSDKELFEEQYRAWLAYRYHATRPRGDYRPGMKFPELEKATETLNALNDEIERRYP